MSETILDTRGLMCPEPVLKAESALQKLQAGCHLLVLTTDQASPIDFEAWCLQNGHRYIGSKDSGNWLEIRIEKISD